MGLVLKARGSNPPGLRFQRRNPPKAVISSRVAASVALPARGLVPHATNRCNHPYRLIARTSLGCGEAVVGRFGLKLSASSVAKVNHPALIGPRSEGFVPNMTISLCLGSSPAIVAPAGPQR